MVLKFRTKRDINGNTYYLVMDTSEMTFHRNRYVSPDEGITITRKDYRKLEAVCESEYAEEIHNI